MKRRIHKYLIAFVLVMIWLLGPGASEAQAYIDPGTGSSLLGSMGIIFAVVSAFVAVAFQHVRGFFSWLVCKVGSMIRKPKHIKEAAPKTM